MSEIVAGIMKIRIVCVGKTKQRFIETGIAEYAKRLPAFAKIETIIVPDVKLTSANNISLVKKQESEIIKKQLQSSDFKVVLDENGKELSSPEFAEFLAGKIDAGKNITFIIGGVYGLDPTLMAEMDFRLSFSRLTFTHQMIRLILFEQIYRAFTIIKGKKYHY